MGGAAIPAAGIATLWWEHIGNAAMRRGRWKLVKQTLGPWQLYDIDSDRGETRDLILKYPEVAEELQTAWLEKAAANGVIPSEDVFADYERRGQAEQAAG